MRRMLAIGLMFILHEASNRDVSIVYQENSAYCGAREYFFTLGDHSRVKSHAVVHM
jgi:hypothetical protein